MYSGYYIKDITNGWNSKNKDKKRTIATFGFPLTPSLTNSPQTPKAYVSLPQMVTYYLWWVLWYFKEFKNKKLDKWQKILLSLRSNPQTGSSYIQDCDGLCTRTDHHMLLPIVLYMVMPLC